MWPGRALPTLYVFQVSRPTGTLLYPPRTGNIRPLHVLNISLPPPTPATHALAVSIMLLLIKEERRESENWLLSFVGWADRPVFGRSWKKPREEIYKGPESLFVLGKIKLWKPLDKNMPVYPRMSWKHNEILDAVGHLCPPPHKKKVLIGANLCLTCNAIACYSWQGHPPKNVVFWLLLSRVVYQLAYRETYHMETRAQMVYSCCPGWMQRQPGENGCLKRKKLLLT